MSLRIVMLGTGTFALPVFRALYDSPHEVAALFTQPDRLGRGHHRHRNPLKELAREHGTPVFQPESINEPEGLGALRNIAPDLGVVAAYGQILSAEVIAAPERGCINVHASLLPKYRGAAPVHYAILNGETETGITIFQIEPQLDAGMILGTSSTAIGERETTGQLESRLAELAVPLTLKVLDDIERGTTNPVPQDPALVTKAPSMRKAFGEIDWSKSAARIRNHVRAMQPWPTPFSFLHQLERQPLRVIVSAVEPCEPTGEESEAVPGTVAFANEHTIVIQTGDGLLRIERMRPEGKREMTAAEFQHGHSLQAGRCRFGPRV